MPVYIYEAKKGPHKIQKGKIEAEDLRQVIKKIKEKGLYPLVIKEEKKVSMERGKITQGEIYLFIRQLSELISAGLPLARALSTLGNQIEKPILQEIIKNLHNYIEKGLSFSEALRKYPQFFDPFCISMIKIGEVGGNLDKALAKVAEYGEKKEELTNQLKSTLAYPSLLLITGAITIFVLVSFVIPKFVKMFEDIGQLLPLPTQILVSFSTFMGKYWWGVLLIIFISVLFFHYYSKNKKLKVWIDDFKLNLPLANQLIKNLEISRICYTLANLLERGIPIIEALGIGVETTTNTVYGKHLRNVQKRVEKGEALSESLDDPRLFPPLIKNMLKVGEEGGRLAEMLFRIASLYEGKVNRNLKALLSILEPALILLIGSIIGLLVWSILLPIFQMNLLIE